MRVLKQNTRRRRTWISVIAAIAYCRATVKALVPPNEVPVILGTSRNNAAAGVTGMLLGSFFQLLVEGERSVIEALYEKVEAENRHHHNAAGKSLMRLGEGRAKTLLAAFKEGRWHKPTA